MLARLAEIAMNLAEAAAEQALQDWAAPAAAPAEPEPATPQPTPAPARTPRAPDYGLLFARLSRAVRQTIALEARIAADHAAATRAAAPIVRPPADPRRPILRRALMEATQDHPDRAQLRRDAEERLDYELLTDPERLASPADLLAIIAHDLAIDFNLAHLPDELVFATPITPDDEDDPTPPWLRPLLQATSPPALV